MSSPDRPKGFASMTPERRREIASRGGRSAHVKGVAHEFTSDQARSAGRRGGLRVAQDRDHMASIGSLGGYVSQKRRKARQQQPQEEKKKT